jgi:hypothetical protein
MNAITYCGNIHPTQNVDQLLKNLEVHQGEIRKSLGIQKDFPVGLWLPNTCIQEALDRHGEIADQLESQQCKLVTLNAFPFGNFHGAPVKEKVYLPDWSMPERLEYSCRGAELGAKLQLKQLSISTLSGGFRPLDSSPKKEAYIEHWLQWVKFAKDLETETGTCAQLALEPEPFNTLEDHQDAIEMWKSISSRARHKNICEDSLRRHLGICFDTCHFSVRFIEPLQAWKELKQQGVPVHKIQVSVAPRLQQSASLQHRQHFWSLQEPTYLHQSYHRHLNGELSAFVDLPQAQQAGESTNFDGEWRTHFHVPIHWGDRPETTGAELVAFLRHLKPEIKNKIDRERTREKTREIESQAQDIPLLEIETYSFMALDSHQNAQNTDINSSIIQEWQWLTKLLDL